MTEPITLQPEITEAIEDLRATLYKHLVRTWLSAEIDHLKQAALTQGRGRADSSLEEAFEQELFAHLEQDTERNDLLKRYYYKAQTYKEHDIHRYTAAIRLILTCLDPTDPFNRQSALEVIKIHLGGDMNHPRQLPLPFSREVSITTSFPTPTVSHLPSVQDVAFKVLQSAISEIVKIEDIKLEAYGNENGYYDTHLHLTYTTHADVNDSAEVDIYDVFDHIHPLMQKHATIFASSPLLKDWYASSREELVGRESKLFKETVIEPEEDQDSWSFTYNDKERWDKSWPDMKAELLNRHVDTISELSYECETAGLITVFITYRKDSPLAWNDRLRRLTTSLSNILKQHLGIDADFGQFPITEQERTRKSLVRDFTTN